MHTVLVEEWLQASRTTNWSLTYNEGCTEQGWSVSGTHPTGHRTHAIREWVIYAERLTNYEFTTTLVTGYKMTPLPSLFQLGAFTWEDSLVAVASRVVTAQPGDIESWDLTLYGEAFESLSCDPFSFKGRFLDHGLRVLHNNLLGPGGFIFPPSWHRNPEGDEYHATVHWMPLSRRITEYG